MLASVLLYTLLISGSASAELTGMDIGPTWPPNPPGNLTIITPGSDYDVDAAGRDIWDVADSFYYAYEPVLVTGDFEAIVRVDSLTWLVDPLNVNGWAKAGIMARANLTDDSAHAFACRSGHYGVCLQARQVEGRFSISKSFPSGDVFGSPIWIKLARKGNVFAAWYAQDISGSPGPWQDPNVVAVAMPDSVFLGLATSSHLNTPPNNLTTAKYRQFSVGPLTDFPPLPNFGPFPGPEGAGSYMGIREVIDNGNINSQDDCNDSLTSLTGTIVDYTAQTLNIQDSGPNGHFGNDDVFGVVTVGHRAYGGVQHISLVAKGAVEIPADDYYTFCLNTDDGFTLLFPGRDFTGIYGDGEIVPFARGNALRFWGNRPVGDTLGIIYLPAGHHPFVLTYHEQGDRAAVEFSAAPGIRTYFDDDFLLVGSQDVVFPKPPVLKPPEINYGAGWPVTMVYQPYTAGTSNSEELDSAIANVQAAWGNSLPGPNVVNATTRWLNYEDPQAGGGGKDFPQLPFPGSQEGFNNNNFAMGAGTKTPSRLFAIRDGFNGTYVIDITTGIPTLIGPSAVAGGTCGLAHSGGSVLYGSIPYGMSVIQTDGSGASVWGSQGMEGMAYDITTDTLYAAINTQFFTVDTVTGNRLLTLPNWPDDCEGLTFVPSVGTKGSVYGIGFNGRLYSYDVALGTFSLVGDTLLGTASDSSGLAYAPGLDVLFHITRNTGDLYTIDKNTAAATWIANTGFGGVTGFSGLAYGPGPITTRTIMTIYDQGYALTDQFDYWEDQTSHSYATTGMCYQGAYVCDGDNSLRITGGIAGTGSARIIVKVTPGTDEIKLRYKVPWVNSPSDNTLYIDGVDKGSIVSNSCNWQEIIISGVSAHTADGKVEIKIADEAPDNPGDVQITYIEVYSLDPGLYTFLIHGDDSSQFRILDLAGGDPLDWDINDYEMTGGNEIVRLPDGSGFRFHGCCADAKGTIRLAPGDYEVQVMFNERTGYAYYGMWSSLNGSQIFLLGDTTAVPAEPEIQALNLVCPYRLLGDTNHDCRINFLDIAIVAMNWLIDCTMDPSDPACIYK